MIYLWKLILMTNMRRMHDLEEYDVCSECGRMIHVSFMQYYKNRYGICDGCRRDNIREKNSRNA